MHDLVLGDASSFGNPHKLSSEAAVSEDFLDNAVPSGIVQNFGPVLLCPRTSSDTACMRSAPSGLVPNSDCKHRLLGAPVSVPRSGPLSYAIVWFSKESQ